MEMANQEFQQSAARAESYVEKGSARNATIEVYNELIKIENGKGTPQQKSAQEAEFLKVVIDQNKVLKQHGFPEFDITENGQSLTMKSSSKQDWSEQPLPAFAYGKAHENLGNRPLTSENVSDQPLKAEKPQMAPEGSAPDGILKGQAEHKEAVQPIKPGDSPKYVPQYVRPDETTSTELPQNAGYSNFNLSAEQQARNHLHRLSNGAIDISSAYQANAGPIWEGQESRNLHYGNNSVNNVRFDIRLPFGVQNGDVVEGRISNNDTNRNSDVVRGRVVSVNGQLHFQGDETLILKDGSGNFAQADNRHVGPYDNHGQLDIPLTLHN